MQIEDRVQALRLAPRERLIQPSEALLEVLVGITRTLWRQAQLFVRYELERNASPVAGYDYDRNRVSASIEIWR